ncbi:MAG: hypothetical protein U0Y82_07245 [Thermoleophilia bacterium]
MTARGLAAMACGLPLIAPDRPGVSEYLPQNAGIVVPTRRRLCTPAVEGTHGPHAVMAHETPVDALVAALRTIAGDAALRARMGAVAAGAPAVRDGREAMGRAVAERVAAAAAGAHRRITRP